MATEEEIVYYGYVFITGLLVYCILFDIYQYLILLGVVHIVYKKFSQKYMKYIQPKGKGVFITGCDTGFGHFVAKRLVDKGFEVFAGCYLPDGDGANALRTYRKDKLHVLQLDVTNDDSVKSAVETIEKRLPKQGLWAVINNAAINRLGDFEFMSIDLMKQVEEVNYYGMVRVTKAVLPMIRTSKGRVINVTSVKGRIALPSDVTYTTTKWAGEAMSDILRREMKRFGVKVIIVEPGNFGGITGMLNERNRQLVNKSINDAWDKASDSVKQAYGRSCIDELLKGISDSGETSAPTPDPVIDAMEEAVSNIQPQSRYLIHGGTKRLDWYCVCAIMNQLLPEPIVDWFLEYTSPSAKVAQQVR